MTPERAVYLSTISKKERLIRNDIEFTRQQIKTYKHELCSLAEQNIDGRGQIIARWLKGVTIRLSAYRYELNRLKGMNRMVEPEIVPLPPNPKGQKNVTVCKKCGTKLIGPLAIHCPGCGRYIMWWRLKLDG